MEMPAVIETRESYLLARFTRCLSRSIRSATASLSITKRNANQTPAFDFALTTIAPRDHQLLPRESAPLSSTALLGAILGSIGGVILLIICCFFYIRFRAWSNASMAASSRQRRWRRAYYYHDSSSTSSSGTSSTSSSSQSTSTRTILRDVEMGEAWPAYQSGVAGTAQTGYGYGSGQGNGYGQANGQAHRGYGVGFEGGATAGKAAPGNVATGYGPGVAQAPRVPPVAVATTKWNPHIYRQGRT
ncbi:hypothetical protein SMACR_04541 [Sordaria macrospora]|uniref:Transmembrane protein n=1 Tax=Sordaria macrospora TaxID=5147 RepID=A0A8S8ZML5_SORMA|nr:hypothetical protein SMACR_04541 [Sordaria macrospora]WPJ62761.1 hypothetical protein SMAC4_04541 [Sordaria macrospora]